MVDFKACFYVDRNTSKKFLVEMIINARIFSKTNKIKCAVLNFIRLIFIDRVRSIS